MNINRDAWLAAFEAANQPLAPDDPDAVTSKEFGELFGMSADTAQKRLRALVTAGKAAIVAKRIQDAKGVWQRVQAYRLVKP